MDIIFAISNIKWNYYESKKLINLQNTLLLLELRILI